MSDPTQTPEPTATLASDQHSVEQDNSLADQNSIQETQLLNSDQLCEPSPIKSTKTGIEEIGNETTISSKDDNNSSDETNSREKIEDEKPQPPSKHVPSKEPDRNTADNDISVNSQKDKNRKYIRRPIHNLPSTTYNSVSPTMKFCFPLATILVVAISIFYSQWIRDVNGSAGSRNAESVATITTTTTTLAPRISKSQSMSSHFDALKRKYPSQTRSFWANVESTFAHSVQRAKDPSIVLVVSDARTHATADALTNDLFDLYTSLASDEHAHLPRAELVIDPLEPGGHIERLISNSDLLDGSGGDRVKLAIDEKLKRIFGTHGAKLALVRNIEHIPAKSMLLFYTYGDDLANAKYPGVLILMTLRIGREISASERDELLKRTASLTHFVERHLIDLWSRAVGDDQLKPLFTRIANNIVLVNVEGDNEQTSQ